MLWLLDDILCILMPKRYFNARMILKLLPVYMTAAKCVCIAQVLLYSLYLSATTHNSGRLKLSCFS